MMTKSGSMRRYTLSLALLVGATALPVSAAQFRIAVMPDTQFYSASPETSNYLGRENPFETQVRWIIANQAIRDIAFTIHVGDIVDDSTDEGQWVYADATMRALDQAIQPLDAAGVPYGVVRGNHDAYDAQSFLTWFGPQRFAGKPTYRGSDPTGYNSYHVFVVDGQPFLVLLTNWRMSEEELSWAEGVLNAFPTMPTILVSHQILTTGNGTFMPPVNLPVDTANGQLLWDRLVADHDQVFMTLNGHHFASAWRVKPNAAGNGVLQILTDYQFAFANGAGYLLELALDTDAGMIQGRTFSPWLEEARSGGAPFPLPTSVLPTEITVPSANFSIAMDFGARFCTSLADCNPPPTPAAQVVPTLPLAGQLVLGIALGALGVSARGLTRRTRRARRASSWTLVQPDDARGLPPDS